MAGERLPGWIRPSNWYLTGFMIPSGAAAGQSADKEEDALEVTVSWGDYEPVKLEDDGGRIVSVWQRIPRLEKLRRKLGDEDPGVSNVPESGGLVLHLEGPVAVAGPRAPRPGERTRGGHAAGTSRWASCCGTAPWPRV